MTACDYSSARPGGAALKAAGITSVGRYLTAEGDPRGLTGTELADLTTHGVAVWFVREGASQGMLAGRAQGVTDAQIAAAALARLGLGTQVVYAAADFDVQPAQVAACDAYLEGFGSVLGVAHTGIYGGMYYLNHARTAGLASFFWKAAATSWDHGQSGLMHIQQTVQTPPVPGSDHDLIHIDDHGQTGTVVSSGRTRIVKEYHYQDRVARDLAPGSQTYLRTGASDQNVVGGVGPYMITAHVYADTMTAGDALEVALVWENTANKPPSSKPSVHYTERFVADSHGLIRGNITFQHDVNPGDMVFLRVLAPATNHTTAHLTVIDSDASLFA